MAKTAVKKEKEGALLSGLGETLGELEAKVASAEKALLSLVTVRGKREDFLEAAFQYGQVARRHRRLARKTKRAEDE